MGERGGLRRWVAAVGVAVTMVAGVVAAPPVSAQEHEQGDGMLPPGDWTPEQEAYLLDLIARTEADLPAFGDASTLESLGFENFGATAPGGWDHWTNLAWIDDEHILDPEFPESLVFRHTSDGGYQLQAAMFFLPSQFDMSNIPADLAWLPGWHTHPELCVDENGQFTGLVGVDGTCSQGEPAEMPPMMHVWIVDNACGHRFAGIGVSGLICDVSHDGPMPDEPMPDEPMPDEPAPTDAPTTNPPPSPPVAPVARAVAAQPSYTG